MKTLVSARIGFGEFEINLKTGELRSGDETIRVPEKPFQVLRILLEFHGELVTREEIQKRLWPNDTVVDFEHGINAAIRTLRRLLRDSADQPRCIETFARRGYRFMLPIQCLAAADDSPSGMVSVGPEAAATQMQPEAATLIGKKVSHYRVLEVIGGGGMGMVYKAEDLKLGRQVALKFLPPELASDPIALQRFEREARAASSLDHPNICTVHEVDEHERQPFIVMQLLRGETLRDRLATLSAAQKRLTVEELFDIALQVCNGLEVAHANSLIHRDIKPANIFLTATGQVKILDFGLAKLVDIPEEEQTEQSTAEQMVPAAAPQLAKTASVDTSLTRLGIAMGTAGYMSPEQARGEKLDGRTDIFSFGLVLYEMATGQRAFSGETAAVVHDAILNDAPIPVRELNSNLPLSFVAIIHKALEKNREHRYQSAVDMRAALQEVEAPTLLQWLKASAWYAAGALALVITMAGLLYLWSRASIKFTDKDAIVVAHFINATNDIVMDDALDFPLNRELQESPYLTVLQPSKISDILKVMNISPVPYAYAPQGPQLTPKLAREVCLRSDSKAFVTASIANLGNYYHIALSALDCNSGRTLAKVETETNERNQIVKWLGVAGHQLRRELGEPKDSLRRFNTPLDNETSWSLEALQAFNQGLHLRAERETDHAIPLFKRAVELDPNFAAAYANLAVSYSERPLQTTYMTAAFNLRERLSQRSRWATEASYYMSVTGELEKATATLVQWLQIFPADPSPHSNLAICLGTLGQRERAAVEFREAARLSPSILTYGNLMSPFIRMNRLEEAKAVFQEARARGMDTWNLRSKRYLVAFLEHDSAGMQEQLSWAIAKPEIFTKEWALQKPGDNAMYHGQFRAARKVYSSMRAVLSSSTVTSHDGVGTWQVVASTALADVETGRPLNARRSVESAIAAAPPSSSRQTLALVLARAGAVSEAEKLVESIDHESPLNTLVQKFELPAIRAAIELNKNQPARAIKILQPVLPYDLAAPQDSLEALYPVYLRGLAYLQLGKGIEATAEFQKMIDHPGILEDFITGPLSHLQLARAQVMMGDKEAARKSYQEFLTIWKDADADIPIFKQAKAEYTKLQ